MLSVIYGWPWTTIWAAVSAMFSMVTVAVAVWAIVRWKKQDELKAKMDFKIAIAEFMVFALSLHNVDVRNPKTVKEGEKIISVSDAFMRCRKAWWMLEGLLDDNNEVKHAWDFLSENTSRFLGGVVAETEITNHCKAILVNKFVFK